MPLATPVIVQSAAVSVPVAPGSDPEHPVGYNNLTLPNPVTVGNLIVFFGTGGLSEPPWYYGFGNVIPPGWASEGATGNAFGTEVYSQIATSPVPPIATIPYGGFSSQSGIMLEIANAGSFSVQGNEYATNVDVATLPVVGTTEAVAPLFICVVFGSDGNGFTYSAPVPAGTAIGQSVNSVDLFDGSQGWGVLLSVASVNPVAVGFTRSAPFTGSESGTGAAGFIGLIIGAGNKVEPVVPPVNLAQPIGGEDVLYTVVERVSVRGGVPYRFYTVEVMASRLLGGNLAQAQPNDIAYSWAVDAGVQVAPALIDADLWITPGNAGALGSVEVIVGGDDYPAVVVAQVVDLQGNGTGAEVTLTVTAGVITAAAITAAGSGYVQPALQLVPSTGDGAVFALAVSNACTLIADAAVFTAGNVGEIVRAAGGVVQITALIGTTSVSGNVLQPFSEYIPNTNQPASSLANTWSMGPQISQLPYLDHLEGMQVVGVADGAVVGPLTVTNGAVPLPSPASIVTMGLGYVAQVQTLRLDVAGGATLQGKRKKISAVTLRVQDTQGLMVGSTWSRMTPMRPAGYAPSNAAVPLSQGGGVQGIAYNGLYGQQPVHYLDQRIIMDPSWNPDGQICIQQSSPLPMTILAAIPEISVGDT
jgi:hypothetical protein